MARANYLIDPGIFEYFKELVVKEPVALSELRARTVRVPGWGKMLSAECAHCLRFLIALTGARRCLDVGTFTGVSAVSMALAVGEEGVVHTCEQSKDYLAVAEQNFRTAGMDKRITTHLAPATETLQRLHEEMGVGSFDFAFIDADKGNNERYFQQAVQLVRDGGVIVIDNIFWYKQVIDLDCKDAHTQAVRAFNLRRASLADTEMTIIPLGDGLMLVRVTAELRDSLMT